MKQKLLIIVTGLLLFSVMLESFRGFVSFNKETIEYSQESDNEEKDTKYESNELLDIKAKPVQHFYEMLFSAAQKNQYASICPLFDCSHYLSMPEMPPEHI